MDEPVVPAAKSAPRERTFFDVAVDRIWRFFCSTRIAIAQSTVMAVQVLLGTVCNCSIPPWIA